MKKAIEEAIAILKKAGIDARLCTIYQYGGTCTAIILQNVLMQESERKNEKVQA